MPETEFKSPDFNALIKKINRDVFIIAEREAVVFFKGSFDNGGFTNESFKAWDKRVDPDYRPGGKLMISSGWLRDSIEMAGKGSDWMDFGAYAQYAGLHNEGGTINIPVTPKSRKFFWMMYKKTGVERWKWLAITKKTSLQVNMPKRQFMGESVALMNILDQKIIERISYHFQNLKDK